jgi:Domain of unknown function (DUF4166)
MAHQRVRETRAPNHAAAVVHIESPLADLRFRALLTAESWEALPHAVRRRFSKRLGPGATIVYTGTATELAFSQLGWVFAHALRLAGGPLPLSRAIGTASVVTVTEDLRSGGQVWTRLYARRSGFPQVIHSTKRFEGATGLEEHIGYGIGMSLSVSVEDGALVFRSHRYFVAIGRRRWHLPRWMAPGALTVRHIELDAHRFAFTLDIDHPRLGRLIHQRGEFEESLH